MLHVRIASCGGETTIPSHTCACLRTHTGSGGGKGLENVGEGPFTGVVRAKGHFWIASSNAYPVDFHVAGETSGCNALFISLCKG